MGRSPGDTNLQLKYRPRPSEKADCCHNDFDFVRPTRDADYWFKMCRKCREVVWG